MARLLTKTQPAWVQCVIEQLDHFLVDHAACERKASATAMSLVVRYPDKPELVDAMITLAREELEHFHQVFRLVYERGGQFGADEKDPYIQQLRGHVRHGWQDHFLDRLLMAGVVESRGCERFSLLAEALEPGRLKDFYQDLTRSEARHAGQFVRLARQYFANDTVETRLGQWLEIEAEVVDRLPIRAALH